MLRRAVARLDHRSRTVLAVTRFRSLRAELRVLALEQGWHIVFASTLEDAVEIRRRARIAVVLYDRDFSCGEWRVGLRTLASCGDATCVILLSHEENSELRHDVVEQGGFDVARDPFDTRRLARLMNGALALEAALYDAASGLGESRLAIQGRE
jgi:DNA-binding NtrC family response regulator